MDSTRGQQTLIAATIAALLLSLACGRKPPTPAAAPTATASASASASATASASASASASARAPDPPPRGKPGGRLPPEVIQRIVRQNFGSFRLCYENSLRNCPNLQGRVAVRFVIDSDGSVKQPKVA